jgi:hypothetical protein
LLRACRNYQAGKQQGIVMLTGQINDQKHFKEN